MPTYKHVVCLANSRRPGGRCFAGKELTADGYGGWVRPVSSITDGGLSMANISYGNGEIPKLLDTINVPLLQPVPHFFQSENHLNDAGETWVKTGEIPHSALADMQDRVDTLWLNGYHSSNGLNDKVPESIAKECIGSSLALIKPTKLSIHIGVEWDKWKARAQFEFNHVAYHLTITDVVFESLCRTKANGTYPVNPEN